jgi:hypothetical protein
VEPEHEKVAGRLLRGLLVTTLDELGHFRDGPHK